MLVIEYGAKDFEKVAWKAIDERQPVQIVVRDGKRGAVKKALDLYRQYFDGRRKGVKDRSLWFKFGYYAIRMPTFWGIYNHAELARAQVVSDEQGDSLLISFFPADFTREVSATH